MANSHRSQLQRSLRYYFTAKQAVIDRGFASEILWQDYITLESINTQTYYSEYAWVVLSSGMKETVIRQRFPMLSKIFEDWSSPELVAQKPKTYARQALGVFNHFNKINSIVWLGIRLAEVGVEHEVRLIKQNGAAYLESYPFLGSATSLHFAKNIGLRVAKPDRHLIRISQHLGYKNPEQLCDAIAQYTGEKQSVIDVILWRYATIQKNYLQ